MRTSLARSLAALLLCLSCFGLFSCATVAQENMRPEEVAIVHSTEKTVAVSVLGGVDGTFGGMEEVPVELFEGALRESIDTYGPFAGVTADDAADYRLEVTVYPMVNQNRGLTYNQKLVANWKLSDKGGAILHQQRIEAEHEVTVGQAFSGATRMVRTTEGASRKNIRAGLETLSQLQL